MTWLKEPLLHFIAIGLGLFALYLWLNPEEMTRDDAIVVTPGQIESLAAKFSRTWNRPPSEEELSNLVDGYIVDEIYYRQALEMGLDRDDPVVRRRLRQKMEFITSDLSDAIEVSGAELQAYLDANPEKFRVDPVISFEQVYFSSQTDPAGIEALKGRLNSGEPIPKNSTLLPSAMEDAAASAIDRQFGEGFAIGLEQQPTGQWSGPLQSGFGLHLVRVASVAPHYLPPLAEVRREVEREWRAEQRRKTRDRMVDSLLAEYDVTVQWPADTGRAGGSSS